MGRRERRKLHNADPPPANAHAKGILAARKAELEAFTAGRKAEAHARARAAPVLPDGQRVVALGVGSSNALHVEGIGCALLAGAEAAGMRVHVHLP